MSKELDEACARALGKAWRRPTHGMCCTCQLCGWDYDNCQCGYADDPEKARLLEDDIERRGLQAQYIYALERVILSRDHWEYIRATPEHRARAFLEAVKGS